MTKRKELRRYLEGLCDSMPKEIWKLAEILELQVFELCEAKEGEGKYLIPYMMNDAVEDYLFLTDCKLTGEYLPEKEIIHPSQIIREREKYVLIARQEDGNVFTLYFRKIEEKIECYRYHEIGHFWVKGQEQWRQIVYMLGTVHDKFEYIGESVCNKAELELMPLMEFPPLRDWSPIHESLEGKYPFTYEGIDAMERIAEEAGDGGYARLVRVYRKFPCKMFRKILSRRLLEAKSEKIYRKIREKLAEASSLYNERRYADELEKEITKKRKEIDEALKNSGYSGIYPVYEKENVQVVAAEEHPFTREEFEYDDYAFGIKLMVSEVKKKQPATYLAGFFRGRGRRGWITEKVDEIPIRKEK